jgi:hypothetical protein
VGTWTLTLIVLALIAIAVADELAIAHPGDDATLGFTFSRSADRRCSCSPSFCSSTRRSGIPRGRRTVGLGALTILAVAAAHLTLIAGIAASSALLIAVAIADTIQTGVQAPGRPAYRRAPKSPPGA